MRYREMRWPCEFPVRVLIGSEPYPAMIVNVSAGGARLCGEQPFEAGSVITLDLGSRRLAAVVRWARAGMFGLRLLTPLSKQELAMVRRGRAHVDAAVSGRWNTHLRELR